MRKLLILLLAIFTLGCDGKMDVEQAKVVTEELIVQADKLDFVAVENIYSPDFRRGETQEDREEKLRYLKRAMGDHVRSEFMAFTLEEEFGQPRKLVLEYRVHYSNMVTIQKISVIEEEGGYRVERHSIRNEEL